MNPHEPTLESWKEIAAYLQRDAKTARKWEKEEGLPVHRHTHSSRSSVYAYASEIDAWRASRKTVPEPLPLWKTLLAPPRSLALGVTLALCLVMVGNGIRPQTASAQQGRGMSTRRVWEPPNIEARSISPDGRYLVYTDWANGDLALRDLTTNQSRSLEKGSWGEASAYAEAAVMSPDGRQIAYTWFTTQNQYHSIRAIPVDGSAQSANPRVAYNNAEVDYAAPAAWTPDGREILVKIQRKDQTWYLAFVPISGGPERAIKSTDWSEPEARLSPDGHYIAYDVSSKQDSPERDIFLLAADGSRQQTLIEHPANDRLIDWTPDGKGLLFGSTRTGNWSLWMIPVQDGKASGAPALVQRDQGQSYSVGITRTGGLYYTVISDREDVFVANIDMEQGQVAAQPAPVNPLALGDHAVPMWSPDRERLASLYRKSSIAIRSGSTGQERLIFPNIEIPPNRASLHWSPDGLSLLVTGRDHKNRHGLYRVDVQTAAVTPLVQMDSEFPLGVYSADGQRIFYIGPTGVFVRDLKTGSQQKVAERDLGDTRQGGLALSPDGKWLAIGSRASDQEGLLEVAPAAGGAPRVLHRKRGAFSGLQWTPDGRSLLYRSGTEVYQIPVEGGEPRPLGVKVVNSERGQFSLHADGRRIAFVAGDNKQESGRWRSFCPSRVEIEPAPGYLSANDHCRTSAAEVWVLENFCLRRTVVSGNRSLER